MPVLMIAVQFLFLIGAMTALAETGKRRGLDPWSFIVIALVGFFVLPVFTRNFLPYGTELGVSWGWVGLVYGSLFLIGGRGIRFKESWQCPACQMYSPPTTLFCPCGQVRERVDPKLAAKPSPPLIFGVWPKIEDQEGAVWAIRQGILAAAVIIGMELAGWALALIQGIRWPLAYVSLALGIYLTVALGLYFKSRLAAVLGLTLYALSTAYLVASGEFAGVLSLLIILLFVGSLRGTFRYHQFAAKTESPGEQPPIEAPGTS